MTKNKYKNKILKQRADVLKIKVEHSDVFDYIIEGLEFVLADESYVLDSTYVSEVVVLKDITALPCTPDFILGIINVRGKILSVIDLKRFFNLPEKGITNLNRVIVVKYNGVELGILADEIVGSIQVSIKNLQPKITEVQSNFIIGITEQRLIVLDIKMILSDKKLIVDETV